MNQCIQFPAEKWYTAEIINQLKVLLQAILMGDRHKILILKKGKKPLKLTDMENRLVVAWV